MSRLVLQNVTRDFGGNKGVFDVNLEVDDGEFFVILGPSGCDSLQNPDPLVMGSHSEYILFSC